MLWKDVPRDSHRGSAPGAGRAADPAAASSRGGGSGALRREGPASARTHPDRRHADRAARSIVPRSRARRARKCPRADRWSSYPVKALAIVRGQAIVTVAGKGMVGVHGIAARTFGAIEAEQLSVSTIFQASSESSIGFTLAGFGSAARGEQPAACVPRGARERPDRQRDRAARDGRDRRRRRRHGRQLPASRRASSRRSRPAGSTSSPSRRGRRSATSRSR